MKRYLLGLIVVALIAVGVFYVVRRQPAPDSSKLQVVTSFYPLYFFAQQIGRDKIELTNLTPAGAEPHEYELTPQDTATVESSDLLIINGAGLEVWGENVQQNIDTSRTRTVVAGQNQMVPDPHLWLSPVLAQKMANKIAEGLSASDPDNTEYYNAQLNALSARLTALDLAFKTGLANCASREIITSHEAFGYLAAAYDLQQVAISGVSTEEEPSAQDIAALAEFAHDRDIKYIFFESLVSPDLAETLAQEVGAQTLVLDPIEGLSDDDIASGKDYFSQMETNLINLQTALECHT